MAKVTLNSDVTISRWKVKQIVKKPAEEGLEVTLLVKRIICCTCLQSINMNFLGISVHKNKMIWIDISTKRLSHQEEAGGRGGLGITADLTST